MATTIYTSSYYSIGNYGKVYGAMDYSVTEYNDKVRITLPWIGEGWIGGPDTYTTSDSASFTGKVGSTSVLTASLSGSRTKTVNTSKYVWIKAGGSSSNYKDISRTHASQTTTVQVNYTIAGTTYTGTSSTITISPKPSYTITYNKNGGTGSMSTSTKWYGESLTLRSNSFTRSGYTFQGWATSSSSTTVAYANGASYTDNKAITLYAVWKKTITLTYNKNGGSGTFANQTADIYNATTTATFTISSTVPTRTNYNFLGWGAGNALFQPEAQISVSGDTELTAQWELAYVPPELVAPTAYRTNSAGTENNGTGSYGKLIFSWKDASLAGSTLSTSGSATYKEHGSSANPTTISGTVTTDSQTGVKTFTATFGGGNLASDRQYDIEITLTNTQGDYIHNTFISTEAFTIDINADGTAIGLLMIAPDNESGVFAPDYNMYVNSSASSGEDYDLVQALTSIGWSDLL